MYTTGSLILQNTKINTNAAHSFTETLYSIFQRNVRLALMLHDIGKASSYFQAYIRGDKRNPTLKRHSQISSFFLAATIWELDCLTGQKNNDERRIFGYLAQLAVISHHGYLHNLSAIIPDDSIKLDMDKIHDAMINYSDFVFQYLYRKILPEIIPDVRKNKRQEIARKIISHSKNLSDDLNDEYYWVYDDLKSGIKKIDENFLKIGFYLGKFTYSILLEADKLSAAGLHTGGVPSNLNLQDFHVIIENYLLKKNYLFPEEFKPGILAPIKISKKISPNREKVNQIRRAIRHNILTNLERKLTGPNLYSIQVPTGLGKTLSVLCASTLVKERIGKEVKNEKKIVKPRLIYGLPYLSIITQVVDQIMEILPKDKHNEEIILAYHHLTPSKYRDQKDDTYTLSQADLLVKSWHTEYLVTSFHQILNTCFKADNRAGQKFNKLAGTVMILDEIQAIPLKYWIVVRNLLFDIRDLFLTTSFIMSATLPKIVEKKSGGIFLSEGLEEVHHINRISIYFCLNNSITLDDLVKNVHQLIKQHPDSSLLVVVNTRREAQEIFLRIKKNKIVQEQHRCMKFLSASLVPKTKKKVIDESKTLLDNAKRGQIAPPIIVATQCIEAGVDLDFDFVIRDFAPLDSIIQVAGRCNRHGRRNQGKVFVYEVIDSKNKNKKFSTYIYDINLLNLTRNAIGIDGNRNRKFLEPEIHNLIVKYYEEIDNFFREGKIGDTVKKFKEMMQQFKYSDISDQFNLIENQATASFYVKLDSDAVNLWSILKDLCDNPKKYSFTKRREIIRSAREYVVTSYLNKEEIDKLGKDFAGMYLIDPNDFGTIQYDEELGLIIEKELLLT